MRPIKEMQLPVTGTQSPRTSRKKMKIETLSGNAKTTKPWKLSFPGITALPRRGNAGYRRGKSCSPFDNAPVCLPSFKWKYDEATKAGHVWTPPDSGLRPENLGGGPAFDLR